MAILTNTILNLDKYKTLSHFFARSWQLFLPATVWVTKTSVSILTNTNFNINKYNFQFWQIHLGIWTNTISISTNTKLLHISSPGSGSSSCLRQVGLQKPIFQINFVLLKKYKQKCWQTKYKYSYYSRIMKIKIRKYAKTVWESINQSIFISGLFN